MLSFKGSVLLHKNLELYGEYANSALTNDLRAEGDKPEKSIASSLFKGNSSTEVYSALNTGVNLNLQNITIGIRYEKIDPEYRTLGAYYFNNDYENITLNYARPLLKNDKANIAVSFGVQRDNLDNSKE